MQPDRVWELAPLLIPWLEAPLSFAHGKCKPEDILDECEQGRMLVWLAMKPHAKTFIAMVITELVDFSRMRVLRIILANGLKGHLREWLALLPALEEWAKVEGCQRVEIQGRKAWEKLGEPRGYGFEHLVVSKEL